MRHRRRWLLAKAKRVLWWSYLDARNWIGSRTWRFREPDQWRYVQAIRRYARGEGPYAVLA